MPVRTLSDADIELLIERFKEVQKHEDECRFKSITPEQLQEAVKFYQNFNQIAETSKGVILKTVLTVGVSGVIAIFILGVTHWIMKINNQ